MRICSFNVNSVRVRQGLILEYLSEHQPDIVGLQETKVTDEDFPFEPFVDAGYEVSVFGQKSYNGVAVLSLKEPKAVQLGFKDEAEDAQKRFQCLNFEDGDGGDLVVINGYFPQGENRAHATKFPAKVKFYEDLQEHLKNYSPDQKIVVMGDLNISPQDIDIGIKPENAKIWLRNGKCSFLPEEREWIERLKNWGFIDTFRFLKPEEEAYSWFDFRSGGFKDNRGLRIDQIWVTDPLIQRLEDAGIDYKMRAAERPSDHCLIWSDFKD